MYRVLLVEDEEIIRKGIRYSVPWEEYGCSVVAEAENGAVGEEKIAELRPDIVITDITMPVKNGLEMIADTREEYKYIAIILTGYSEFEYAQQAIRNGVSDYVLKPLDMDEMGAALEKAVRLAGDSQYLQKREDEAEAVRSRTALPPLSEEKVTDPLVLHIVAYLKENYQSKITLADLQEQFHYSERYINQKFQKELGTTVIDYLNRCRIQNALELIRKGELPISQIGWECGIGDIKIEGYEDLLNPALKGKIATADPANSSSAFAHLTNMLLAMGGYEDDKAWQYVHDLFENVDGKICESSSAVYKGVADGEYVVGLSYEDPCAQLVLDGAPVKLVYMKEGTVFLPASATIIKGAKNMDNAKLFIDFILSEEVQNIWGSTLTNRPVMKDAATNDAMTPMADINVIEEDIPYVSAHKAELVDKYTEIFTDLQSK